MNQFSFNRRRFIKNSSKAAAGFTVLSSFTTHVLGAVRKKERIKFSVISVNHSHIYGMIETMIKAGGELVSFYAKEPDLAAAFLKKYPSVKKARNEKEILEDPSIHLVLSAGIPVDRAPLGIEVMLHGKDFLVDKPGITTLEQLAEVKKTQQETARKYAIFIERLESPSILRAGELVKSGAIGRVVQTMGTGPHRMNPESRPAWFFDKQYFGGIITDLASHQFDQFLYFTGSSQAAIVAAQSGNIAHPQYPALEDFGDVMLKGDKGTGYIRVDWFTPAGLKSWGDGRLTVLGTEGYMELRKTIDLAGRPGGHHLFLVNGERSSYIDCNSQPLLFGTQFITDILQRTETSFSQEQCFLAAELGLKAQAKASALKFDGK